MEYIINLEQNMEEEKVKDIQLEISVNQQVKEMLVAEGLIEIEIMEMEANLIMMKDVVLVKVLEKVEDMAEEVAAPMELEEMEQC